MDDSDLTEDYRQKYNLHDKNNTRFLRERLQISASRYNYDVQEVLAELRLDAQTTRTKFSVTEALSDLIRDGCRYTVEKYPREATPTMYHIAEKTISRRERIQCKEGNAEGAGLVPLLTEYHRKKLRSESIARRYKEQLISDQVVIDIYRSCMAAKQEIEDDKTLSQVIENDQNQTSVD